jgi:hypothetical protein
MSLLRNIYIFLYSLFEIFSFRSKPEYNELDNNDEYEYIFDKNFINR